jgi:hypothetical protein
MFAVAVIALVGQMPAPTPPTADAPAWSVVKTVDGVTLKRAPSECAVPWGLGEGEIAAPIERVIAHLTDFSGLGRWMPRVRELRVIERGADSAIVYFRFGLPWPISDREWTLRYRWWRDGDHFVMSWQDAHDRGPPPSRAVRVTPMRGYWEVWANGATSSRARYVFLSELGGALPRVVAQETAWKQPLASFRGVRAATAAR